MEQEDVLWEAGSHLSLNDRVRAASVCRRWRRAFHHAAGLHRFIGTMNLKRVYSLESLADEYERAVSSRLISLQCRPWWRKHRPSGRLTRLVDALILAGH